MTDYQLPTPTHRCSATGREILPGESYIAVVVDEDSRFVRRDFAPDAWVGPPDHAIGHWSARVPTGGQQALRPPIDDDVVTECFQRLDGDMEQTRIQFRFVLALLLMRRKRLKFIDVVKDPENEKLLLRDMRTGDRVAVIDPKLSEEQMQVVQAEVSQVLGWNSTDSGLMKS